MKTIKLLIAAMAILSTQVFAGAVFFGDDSLDNGNWQEANIQYGSQFIPPATNNNGKVLSETIADLLGIQATPVLVDSNGNNYAQLGAEAYLDIYNQNTILDSGLYDQVISYVSSGKITNTTNPTLNDLHIISIGGDLLKVALEHYATAATDTANAVVIKQQARDYVQDLATYIVVSAQILQYQGITDITVVNPATYSNTQLVSDIISANSVAGTPDRTVCTSWKGRKCKGGWVTIPGTPGTDATATVNTGISELKAILDQSINALSTDKYDMQSAVDVLGQSAFYDDAIISEAAYQLAADSIVQ